MAEQSSSADALLSLLGKISESPPAPEPAPFNTQNATSDIFSSLLSNPEILSKLPQIMSMIQPLMSSMGGQAQAGGTSAPASILSPSHEPQKKQTDDRSALLYAMKPYLSAERRDAIDYMVKLSRLGDILKSL